jgi:predicted NAD/FAD-dependent oxidoreductase
VSAADPTDLVLVVGAGISGLLAARRISDSGRPVLVLDKGRGVGGRMSSRRIGDARLDHGAQFFTANDPVFRELVRGWNDAGVSREWSRGFAGPDGRTRTGGRPAYRGGASMNAVPKHVARGLDIRTGCRVFRVARKENVYRVETDAGDAIRAGSVLLTAPVPQSLALLRAGNVDLPAELESRLAAIEYDPCFAVLAVLSGPSRVPDPGGVKPEAGPLSWIADNHRKGISPQVTALTLHASAEYTRFRLEADRDVVARELLAAADEWLGSEVREVQVHRWLYGLPRNRPGERFLSTGDDAPLIFAGDAFGGASVEGAALSGLAAGEALAGPDRG